ncbi:hypothetical protein AB1Y20_010274 [Prymnesium parvum]|uniref:Uncharacterized protein n=1 Tax=Prymnesium parvum TaxID=97485 RepID=A0AB34K6A1_PRYPA
MFGRSRLRRERGVKLPRNLFGLLAERERSHAARGLDLELLRWAADEWVRQPQMCSDYCQLHAEAKSTIALAFSADGELFASTHGDHTVKVFSCSSWRLLCTLRGHDRTPWTVKFHPKQRRYLASGSLDQSVRIWDLHTRQCIRRQHFDFVVSCIAFHSTGELVAVTAGKRTFLWQWQAQGGEEAAGDESPGRQDGVKVVLMDGTNPQRCVAFKRSATHELFFVAETNAETPPEPPSRPAGAQQAPPFTVQLFMWLLLPQDAEQHMRLRLEPGAADLRVARSVMYSDAGFDVSCCGRYLALCELDPQARGGVAWGCFPWWRGGVAWRGVVGLLPLVAWRRGEVGLIPLVAWRRGVVGLLPLVAWRRGEVGLIPLVAWRRGVVGLLPLVAWRRGVVGLLPLVAWRRGMVGLLPLVAWRRGVVGLLPLVAWRRGVVGLLPLVAWRRGVVGLLPLVAWRRGVVGLLPLVAWRRGVVGLLPLVAWRRGVVGLLPLVAWRRGVVGLLPLVAWRRGVVGLLPLVAWRRGVVGLLPLVAWRRGVVGLLPLVAWRRGVVGLLPLVAWRRGVVGLLPLVAWRRGVVGLLPLVAWRRGVVGLLPLVAWRRGVVGLLPLVAWRRGVVGLLPLVAWRRGVVGYHLRTFSLQRGSMGAQLQTVVLPNCPFVTSVQFAPLNFAVLIGYGRCQAPEPGQPSRYAVLRCILFDTSTTERLQTEEVELFSVDSHDESNVALFHPQPTAAAQLGFVYATKDGRIRAFRFDR